MVTRNQGIYVFAGEDQPEKEARLDKLKEEFLPREFRAFNLDLLYAREISLEYLQERLLSIPLNSPRRIIIIKEPDRLSVPARAFLSSCLPGMHESLLLVFDFARYEPKNEFQAFLCGVGTLIRFREPPRVDTFMLARQIDSGRAENAIKTLHQLLEAGEKPERILGGLRYSTQKAGAGYAAPVTKEILACDLNIKTGRLKPVFALEKLVVALCRLKKFPGQA